MITIPKSGKSPNYILPTDKFIVDYVQTIWETTTTTAEKSSKRR